MDKDEASPLVTVVARYQARARAGDEAVGVLARHVAPTWGEPGCISFSSYRDAGDPDRFALYEEYADERAWQDHR